jgi:NTE family protein
MNLGLIMGGGGLVGIAWELGVLAGLQESAGLDPTSAAVIVGSSAGSVAGAQAALGKDLRALADRQLETARETPSGGAGGGGAPEPRVIPQSIIEKMMQTTGSIEERARAIGELALDAEVPQREEDYVESFRGFLGTDEWPAVDFRASTAEAETGRSVLWNRNDGIGLVRAVASSCAIPGFFPPVSFNGKHYVDGPRGGYMPALAAEKSLDAILFVGPNAAMPAVFSGTAELDALASEGIRVAKVTGGEALAAIGFNLMDSRLRARAADAGLQDARDAAVEVKALLS